MSYNCSTCKDNCSGCCNIFLAVIIFFLFALSIGILIGK